MSSYCSVPMPGQVTVRGVDRRRRCCTLPLLTASITSTFRMADPNSCRAVGTVMRDCTGCQEVSGEHWVSSFGCQGPRLVATQAACRSCCTAWSTVHPVHRGLDRPGGGAALPHAHGAAGISCCTIHPDVCCALQLTGLCLTALLPCHSRTFCGQFHVALQLPGHSQCSPVCLWRPPLPCILFCRPLLIRP